MIPAQPSRTARRVAMRRAAHQLVDIPRVFNDPLALRILGAETEAAVRANPAQSEAPLLAARLRALLVARSRVAEDALADARTRGIHQYVLLGAGLDTFAYRDPTPEVPLRVWEVDYPATQAWKRQLLDDAAISIPSTVTFVPVDFEHQRWPNALESAGFDASAGAVFAWLGVTPYLTADAIFETLSYIAHATRTGGGVTFDYGLDPRLLTQRQLGMFEALAARVRAAGEPWQTFFDPGVLTNQLRTLGFTEIHDMSPDDLNARFFANRTDDLRVGGLAHIMWAGRA